MNSFHHSMLQFAVVHATKLHLAEAFAPRDITAQQSTMRHTNIALQQIRQCVENAGLLYSALAYSAGILRWMSDAFLDRQPPEYFINKALPVIRTQLFRHESNSIPDKWYLLSLFSLVAADSGNDAPRRWIAQFLGLIRKFKRLKEDDTGSTLRASQVHLAAIHDFARGQGDGASWSRFSWKASLLPANI